MTHTPSASNTEAATPTPADFAAAVHAPPPPKRLPLQFVGSGNDYFRIWITNLLLSVLTLGIYSAWAKVRREKYFHRNTLLDGNSFDYHGKPLPILKGRILAMALLVLLSLIDDISATLYFLAVIVLSPLLPWLILRSFIFRARNTSYRGLRFDFDGTYREIAKIVLGWGALTLLSLGMTSPILLQRLKSFQFTHLSYGGERFSMRADVGGFYLAFLLVSLVVMIPFFFMALLIGVGVALAGIGDNYKEVSALLLVAAVGMVVLIYLAVLLVVQPLLQVRLGNLVWNSTVVGPHRFSSNQAMSSLFPVFLSNWIFILISLGLFWPWAKVRLARYRANHTQMLAHGSLDDFIGQAALQNSALGEEVADAFDLDIGL